MNKVKLVISVTISLAILDVDTIVENAVCKYLLIFIYKFLNFSVQFLIFTLNFIDYTVESAVKTVLMCQDTRISV